MNNRKWFKFFKSNNFIDRSLNNVEKTLIKIIYHCQAEFAKPKYLPLVNFAQLQSFDRFGGVIISIIQNDTKSHPYLLLALLTFT